MEEYVRNSVFARLKDYDFLSEEHGYIEVTEWRNGEGFDVDISNRLGVRFQLTWGEYKALKKLVKKIKQ